MEQFPLGITIASNVVAMVAGIALLLATLFSLFRTIVIPRTLNSTLSQVVMAGVLFTARGLARLRRSYVGRDAVLAWSGPTFIFVILVTWIVLFIVAYGLMIFAISPTSSLGDGIRQSGSSLLTLGFASSPGSEQTFIDFMAAATGPIVIALMIGVLPTIYSLYLDRERPVAILGAMGGEPPWGPEFLVRMTLTNNLDGLPDDFKSWSDWAAGVRLSHLTYPMLIYVRSATANRNYVVALLAMMDAAALKIACNTTLPRNQSFLLLLNGSILMERLYEEAAKQQTLRGAIPSPWHHHANAAVRPIDVPSVSPKMHAAQTAAARDAARDVPEQDIAALQQGEQATLQLTKQEFAEAYTMIGESGFPTDRDLDAAWAVFANLRGRYEYPAYKLMQLIDATPAPWTGTRKIPTKTEWPNLSIPILKQQGSTSPTSATSPDDSSTPPAPDAPHP
jgi:hypothetical protein